MNAALPGWLALDAAGEGRSPTARDVAAALAAEEPGPRELAALLAPAAAPRLEEMAQRAQALTRRHFGRTITLYVPLYLSNFCSSGCVYCGFAADRRVPRRRLEPDEAEREMDSLKAMGFDEVLLLTGERTDAADYPYVRECVARAAARFDLVTVETFPMRREEYAGLVDAGCTGVTLYQETYDPGAYAALHRWGPKRDYAARLDAPERALAAGMRSVGLGVLLGLADPVRDAVRLLHHVIHLRRTWWRAGVSVSFPRQRPQTGGFAPPHPVDDAFLARLICALRLCLPDAHLVLSTREAAPFRDGMAGVGISKMSIASRTTVGGYGEPTADAGQFEVNDRRPVGEFCAMLRARGLEPVFKNWEAVYRGPVEARP